EVPAVSADALLTEEDRPAEGDPDRDRSREQDRGEEYERNRRKKAVERVLDGELHALGVRRVRREEGDTAEVLDAVTLRDSLEEPWHDRDCDAELLAAPDESQQHLVGCRGEGDDDLLDAVLVDDGVEVPARARDGQAERLARVDERLLVQEGHGLEPELGPLEQAPRREAADPPGTDDQRRADALALGASARLRPVEGDPPGHEVDERERPRADRLGLDRERVAEQ